MQVKAAVTLGYQQPFVIKDVDVSPPGKDEILVKIVATGVCHTDAVMRDNPGVVPMPAILGHEGAGIVASIGEAVSGIRVGDHVVLSYAACHHCENCLSNHPSACEDFNTLNFGGRREDGTTPYRLGDQDLSLFFGQSSFSQYVVTRASNAVVVDPEVDLTLLGPLGCGIQTGSGTVLNRLKPVIGESIVVFGCGAVGLSAIMAAKLTGCSQIIAVDIHASRLALAGETGRHPSDQWQGTGCRGPDQTDHRQRRSLRGGNHRRIGHRAAGRTRGETIRYGGHRRLYRGYHL